MLLLLLLPLREARRRSRESPDPRHAAAPEAVPHGRRLLLELSSSGIRSVRAELIRVGRGLSGIHLYDAAAVGGTRRSRSRRGRRGDYPPVEPVIQHGQRREDAGLEPREKDNGRARAGLGEAVVCMSVLKGARFFSSREVPWSPASSNKTENKGSKNDSSGFSPDLRRPRRVEREHGGRDGPPPSQRRRRGPLEPEPGPHARAPRERERERREDRRGRDGVGEGARRGAPAAACRAAARDDAAASGAQEAGSHRAEAELDDGRDGESEEDLQRGEDGGGGGELSRGSRSRGWRRGGG